MTFLGTFAELSELLAEAGQALVGLADERAEADREAGAEVEGGAR